MTKADLLKALEPFTDDIQIMRLGRDDEYNSGTTYVGITVANYNVAGKTTGSVSTPPLEEHEGWILVD